MAQFTIRAAGADDMPALMRLQAQCHDSSLLESETCFASILAHELAWLAVGTTADGVGDACGYALMHAGAHSALNSTVPPRPAGALGAVFLHDVVVTPSHRKAGVGRALVATALAAAVDAFGGCSGEVHLVSLPAVVEYWERVGFRALEMSAHDDDASTYVSGARHMVRTLVAAAAASAT